MRLHVLCLVMASSELRQSVSTFGKNPPQFFLGIGSKHGDTRLLEVGNTFEDRRCSQVSASMQNASVLIYTVDIDAQLFFQNVNLLIDGEGSSPCVI